MRSALWKTAQWLMSPTCESCTLTTTLWPAFPPACLNTNTSRYILGWFNLVITVVHHSVIDPGLNKQDHLYSCVFSSFSLSEPHFLCCMFAFGLFMFTLPTKSSITKVTWIHLACLLCKVMVVCRTVMLVFSSRGAVNRPDWRPFKFNFIII